MDMLIAPIRNAARAVIIRGNDILLLRKEGYPDGERYALPGGGQDLGETLQQALVRECMEEIGTLVQVGDLMHVTDTFKPRETSPPTTRHLVEFLFDCTVPADYVPCNGHHPDKHQVEVVWAGLDDLPELSLYPRSLGTLLPELRLRPAATYLGTLDW